MNIFTIGYEGATQPEAIATLSEAGVELLADVRAVPLSRRPGFSKERAGQRAARSRHRLHPPQGTGNPARGARGGAQA